LMSLILVSLASTHAGVRKAGVACLDHLRRIIRQNGVSVEDSSLLDLLCTKLLESKEGLLVSERNISLFFPNFFDANYKVSVGSPISVSARSHLHELLFGTWLALPHSYP